jgi:UDPglucose--hexose-1-phosphate uridylyltransferase
MKTLLKECSISISEAGMPELRQDPITQRWVVIAKARAKRPDDFRERPKTAGTATACPFEYGNESMTPPETMAIRPSDTTPDTPGWLVRVVPNKFPAFSTRIDGRTTGGLYVSRSAFGAHEVVIHGPDHGLTMATYPEKHVALVLKTYRQRYEYHMKQPYAGYVQIIINHGEESGASLEHSHSQIFVIPVLPEKPRALLDGASRYFDIHARCVFCDIISAELTFARRVVDESAHFLAFEPFAAQLPFETWMLPKEHKPRFEALNDNEIEDLAKIFRRTVRRFLNGLGDPPYNMYLFTAPPRYERPETMHWFMSITPKLTTPAGFEMGTGMTINSTVPEECAEFLRNVKI